VQYEYQLDGIILRIIPVVLIPYYLHASKPVAIQQGPQSGTNLGMRGDRERRSWVGWIAVLRFVLDGNGVRGRAFRDEALHGLE
jgi:hypothetical protein